MNISSFWMKQPQGEKLASLQNNIVLCIVFKDCSPEQAHKAGAECAEYLDLWCWDYDCKTVGYGDGDGLTLFAIAFGKVKGGVTAQKQEIMHYFNGFKRHCQKDPDNWKASLNAGQNRRSARFVNRVMRQMQFDYC